jgi:hypothetical protein
VTVRRLLCRVLAAGVCLSLGAAAAACDRRSAPSAPRAAGADTAATGSTAVPKSQPSYDPQAGQGPHPVPDKVMLGAFLDLGGLSQAQAVTRRRQQLGRDFRILHYYYQWTDPLPTSLSALPADSYPLLSWRGPSYGAILNGSQDALIGQEADRIARYGKPVFIRWAWEMNGSWYVWGGARNGNDPAAFIRCWRHLHDIFQAHHATNVAWTWGPNWYSKPNLPWNDMRNYYPGDQYVDWIAISGYGDSRLTPDAVYDAFYNEYAGRKPIMIAETGVLDKGGTTKPDWIDALVRWVKAHRGVAAVVWYDTDHSPGTPENFRLDSTPGSLAAFRRLAADPYFSG